MTQTAERNPQRTGKSAASALVTAGALPQVNLLPESVRAVRRLRDARGWFGLALLLSIVLVVLAWFGSDLMVGQAEDEKTAENERTSELLAQKAEYAAVTPVLADLQRARAGLVMAAGPEVLWSTYTGAIAAVLPEGTQLQTLSMQPVGDGDGAVLPDDPLVTPGIYQLSFEGRAVAAPNAADVLIALSDVQGFSDPRLTVIDHSADGYFTVVGSVQVTSSALSMRLAEEAE